MTRLAIRSLGTLQITLDATPLTDFDSAKARALLTYLVVESERAHRRGSLVGLFWPDYPERRARHTLSQVLFNVRQVIGDRETDPAEGFLEVTRRTLQFRRASDYWLDVEQLTAVQQRVSAPSAAEPLLSTLEQAGALYHGPFMKGFSLKDSPAFEEWLLLQRERLERAYLEILDALVAAHAAQGAYEQALLHAQHQLDLDPWRESVHRQIMRLLALSGRRTAALTQYETCRETLRDELGVAPDVETTALYERIKTGALTPATCAVPMPALPHPTPPHNLPAQLTPFIGRATEVEALETRLRSPNCRLLTLVGPGGCGKTRLALEVAARVLNDFADGVFFVSLAPLRDPQSIVSVIAQAVGIGFSKRGGSQWEQLLAYLKDKTMLLLLDNAEQLLQKSESEIRDGLVDLLDKILRAARHVKLLVTSRVRMQMLGEHLFPVAELDYPRAPGQSLSTLQNVAAVQLFVESARRVQPDFALRERNCSAVATICAYVRGNPLATLLTATWTVSRSCADIAAALTEEVDIRARLDVLQAPWQNVPPRQRSLRAVFEHSWRLLTKQQRTVFQALSIFCGGFTIAAAAAVVGTTREELQTLLDASLLNRTVGGRYTAHELLRQCAAEKLQQDAAVCHETHTRYVAYYGNALERWAQDARGPRQQEMLTEMDMEIDNARVAWDWAVREGDIAFIDRAIAGLCLFYQRRVRRSEGVATCRAAAVRLKTLSESDATPATRRVLSKVLTWQSSFLPPEQARPVAQRSLAFLDQLAMSTLDMRRERAAALRQLGHINMATDRDAAQGYYEESLALHRALDASWEQSQLLADLGWWAWHTSNLPSARRYLDESLALARGMGDLRTMAGSVMALSGVAMSLGQFEEAARLTEESLALRRKLGDPLEIAHSLYSLGIKRVTLGQYEPAVAVLKESLQIHQKHFGLSGALHISVLAWAKMFMGRYQAAYQQAETALKMMQAADDQRGSGWTYHVLGGICLGLGALERAQHFLAASLQAYGPLDQRMELAFALAMLGYARCLRNQFGGAQRDLVEVLRISQEIHAVPSLIYGIVGMALLLARQHQVERAVEIYALGSTFPCVANSRWFADVVGQHVDTAAAALPPDVVVKAEKRGRARDLWATAAELRTIFG